MDTWAKTEVYHYYNDERCIVRITVYDINDGFTADIFFLKKYSLFTFGLQTHDDE